MKFKVKTSVDQPVDKVRSGFDESLFRQLSPPFPKLRVIRFDGSNPGDRVEVELNFLLFKQVWISEITESKELESAYYFVDSGIQLPFFLKNWKHKHLIQSGSKTEIIDDVEYSCRNKITELLCYPILLSQFIYRKPIYKRIFGQN